MTAPKIQTVNAVTMEHAEALIDAVNESLIASGVFIEEFSEAAILTWPDDDDRPAQEHYNRLANDIRDRLFADTRSFVAEAFVRIANAVIEGERMRAKEPLVPPKIKTVQAVTREHGLTFAEQVYEQTVDSEVFAEAFGRTRVMTFPTDDETAQDRFHRLTNEIRDRLHDETKDSIADAFVRVAGDVIARERRRR